MEVDGEMGWTSASYLQKADLETVDDFAIKKYATGKGESKRAGTFAQLTLQSMKKISLNN